jgi:hypothetical protein
MALLDAARIGKPMALKGIFDNSPNEMTRVNAARSLEIISRTNMEESGAGRGGAPMTPDLVVVIQNPGGPQQIIVDATHHLRRCGL